MKKKYPNVIIKTQEVESNQYLMDNVNTLVWKINYKIRIL